MDGQGRETKGKERERERRGLRKPTLSNERREIGDVIEQKSQLISRMGRGETMMEWMGIE